MCGLLVLCTVGGIKVADAHRFYRGFATSRAQEYGQPTFLGTMRLASRMRLLVLLAFATMAAAGGVYYFAQQMVSATETRLAEAREVALLTAQVRRDTMLVRNEEKNYLVKGDALHIESYDRSVASLAHALNLLYARGDVEPMRELVTTINEGLTQHTAEFRRLVDAENALRGGGGPADGLGLKTASGVTGPRNLKALLSQVPGGGGDALTGAVLGTLTDVDTRLDEVGRLLAGTPLAPRLRAQIETATGSYRASALTFARARIVRAKGAARLDEIAAYMAPSIDRLQLFADGMVANAADEADGARARADTVMMAGLIGALLVLMTLSLTVIHSISAPVRAVASAAGRLAEGDQEVAIPALGNGDEVGDLARTLTTFRADREDATRLRLDREMMKSEIKKEALENQRLLTDLEAVRADQDSQERVARGIAIERDAAKAKVAKIEEEEARLRDILRTAKGELERGAEEAARLRADLEEARAEYDLSADEVARLQGDLSAMAVETHHGDDEDDADEDDGFVTAGLPVSQPASHHGGLPSGTMLSGPISLISDQVAQSSRTVSAATAEVERTGSLIIGLAEAGDRLSDVSVLLARIDEQANMLEFSRGGHRSFDASDENLVMFSAEGRNDPETGSGTATLGRRFDAIRSTARKLKREIKYVTDTVGEVRELALEMAAESSAEALDATSALLEQSGHLRGMLDELVDKINKPDGRPSVHEMPRKPGSHSSD